MLFLHLHGQGVGVVEIFWGLWLVPFGLLVMRSGFLPGLLGVLLIAACVGYLADSLTSLLAPGPGRPRTNLQVFWRGPENSRRWRGG